MTSPTLGRPEAPPAVLSRRLFLLTGVGATLAACADLTGTAPDDISDTVPTSSGVTTTTSAPVPIRLTGAQVTRWHRDPLARGSFSFLPVGATPDDRKALHEPVGGRLFFAGEHTDLGAPGTTHGALASGRRAAQQLLDAEVLDTGRSKGTVVVIGAGFAGLGAARWLADRGVDVSVIEGRDRLGGRAFTSTALGTPVDLGASWIHGVDDNPVAAIARFAGIEWSVANPETTSVFDQNGAPLSDRETDVMETVAMTVVDSAWTAGDELTKDAPLSQMIGAEIDSAEFDPAGSAVLDAEIRRTVEHDFAADLSEISAQEGDEGDEIRGDEVILPRGYAQIVDVLALGLAVTFDTVVSAIRIADGSVTVVTPTEEFEAEAVIVTVPLGVLQAGTVAFDPPLPRSHSSAIGRLGMGTLDKVVLRFAERFWPADVDLIGITREDGRYLEWLNLTKHTGRPMLVGFTAGTPARRLELLSDREIVDDALGSLRQAFG